MTKINLSLPEWADDVWDLLELNGLVNDDYTISTFGKKLPISQTYRFELSNGNNEIRIEHTIMGDCSGIGMAYSKMVNKSFVGKDNIRLMLNTKYVLTLLPSLNGLYHYKVLMYNRNLTCNLYIPFNNIDIIIVDNMIKTQII